MNWTNDDWLTPPSLLSLLGRFDLDPCASSIRPWDTAARHFTVDDNGLRKKWDGRVWLNPPYSEVEAWIGRMIEHRHGMALVNARTDTKWFEAGIWDIAHAVTFVKGRIQFFRPDGSIGTMGGSAVASAIAAYTAADAAILYRAGIDGKFIPLIIKMVEVKTTWRNLIRFFLKECNGTASLEELYRLAHGHPKTAVNRNWKAKVRQQVQTQARRVGPALWKSMDLAF